MKISAKQYATALFELTQDQSEAEIKKIIARLIQFLSEKQALKKLPEIIRYFEKIWQDNGTILTAEITSARELDPSILQIIKTHLQKTTNKKEIEVTTQINQNILGGVIIKYHDKILDASLKTNLHRFKNKLSE